MQLLHFGALQGHIITLQDHIPERQDVGFSLHIYIYTYIYICDYNIATQLVGNNFKSFSKLRLLFRGDKKSGIIRSVRIVRLGNNINMDEIWTNDTKNPPCYVAQFWAPSHSNFTVCYLHYYMFCRDMHSPCKIIDVFWMISKNTKSTKIGKHHSSPIRGPFVPSLFCLHAVNVSVAAELRTNGVVLTKIPGKPTSQKKNWILIGEEAKHQIVVGDVNGFGFFFSYMFF